LHTNHAFFGGNFRICEVLLILASGLRFLQSPNCRWCGRIRYAPGFSGAVPGGFAAGLTGNAHSSKCLAIAVDGIDNEPTIV